tara:strand:+ start:5627 stop:7249 length:1623 start_codon:yes stop_codon:yes gene_type:complete
LAVIQISRIQLRRGKKNVGTGLPQLSSGEMGWAIDTQELYIGNGAVSEGAPAVGNTKILTEKDDILSLVAKYSYKKDSVQTGTSLGSPVERTITQKLDDHVSLSDFGGKGDGTDHTTILQRAIDQLYLADTRKNSSESIDYQSKVTLLIPAGEYLISSVIKVPPFATIIGEGKDKTKITSTSSIIFETVNELSSPGSYSLDSSSTFQNQPQYITIKGMELYSTTYGGVIHLVSCRDSLFEDLKISGNWSSGNGHTVDYCGIKLGGLSTPVSSNNNTFKNIEIANFAKGIYSDNDVYYNNISNVNIHDCGYGVSFGLNTVIGSLGQNTGPKSNTIKDSVFRNIDLNAINITYGKHNSSLNNKFISIGNMGGNSSQATHSIIHFGEYGNTSIGDYFERAQELTTDTLYLSSDYKSDISGKKTYENLYTMSCAIGNQPTAYKFLRVPAENDHGIVKIDYQYYASVSSNIAYKKGSLTFTYLKNPANMIMEETSDQLGYDPLNGGEITITAVYDSVTGMIDVSVVNLFTPVLSDLFSYTIKYVE